MLDLLFSAFLLVTDPSTHEAIENQAAHALLAIQEQAERESGVRAVADFLPVDDALAREIASALQDSCQEFGVERKLMLALIYVESSGRPRIVSHVGAIGLTQIMPATGEQIARELGVEWTGPEMLYDVRTNIRFGTYYMRKLLDRFSDSQTAAVQSYNWGPTSIARMLRNGQTIPTGYANKVFRTRARVVNL